MLAEKSLSWSSTTQWSHFSTTTQLLWLLDTEAKSVHSQAYIVLTLGLFNKRKSSRISMNEISTGSISSCRYPHNITKSIALYCKIMVHNYCLKISCRSKILQVFHSDTELTTYITVTLLVKTLPIFHSDPCSNYYSPVLNNTPIKLTKCSVGAK